MFVDRQFNLKLKQQKDQYEQEIDEYQKNLELALHDNQEYQVAIDKFEDEKASHDEISQSQKDEFEREIESLKQENVQLQAQGWSPPLFLISLNHRSSPRSNEK